MVQKMNMANVKIIVSGDSGSISHASRVLAESARISGIEMGDRLVIQRVIDENDLHASISYNGTPVISYKRVAENLKKMREVDSLVDMTDETYQILSSQFDFPRGNKLSYIQAYKNSYPEMLKGLTIRHASGKSDVNRIAEALESERLLCGLCG